MVRRSFYDKEPALSPFRAGLFRVFGPFRGGAAGAARIGGPEVRTALPGEALGLALAPGLNLGVVPSGQHRGDWAALPDGRAGELGVFEQALVEAFLGPRGFLAHDTGQQPNAGIDERAGGDFPT